MVGKNHSDPNSDEMSGKTSAHYLPAFHTWPEKFMGRLVLQPNQNNQAASIYLLFCSLEKNLPEYNLLTFTSSPQLPCVQFPTQQSEDSKNTHIILIANISALSTLQGEICL